MKKNVGGADRAVRLIVGVGVMSFYFLLDEPWMWAGLIGIVPLLTGLTQFCVINRLLGRNTCKVR